MGKIINWSLALQLVLYPIIIFRKIKNSWSKENQQMNEKKTNQIKWLNFLNFLFLIYGLCMFVYFAMIALEIGGLKKDFYISFVMCLAVYSISYINMTNPKLLKGEKFIERIENLKYYKTKLKKEQLDEIITELKKVMEVEKIYLESDIDLNQITQKLEIPRHHISQALNIELNKSFHEYINSYRINHACKLLQELPKDSNIKTVMYASGFNNRASFNNNFKKLKGMTASDYLKNIKYSV